MFSARGIVILALVVSAGCTRFFWGISPWTVKPQPSDPCPKSDFLSKNLKASWWASFPDPVLHSLEAIALLNNNDLLAAMSRVEQSRALLRVASASLLPTMDASFDVTLARKSASQGGGTGQNTNKLPSTDLSYTALLSVGYEIDLWGKIRSSTDVAAFNMAASGFDLESVTLILTSDVAGAYLLILTLDERIGISQDTAEVERQRTSIIERQYRAGLSSGLDLARSKSELASIGATVPALERQRSEALQALTVLVNQPPAQLTYIKGPLTIRASQIPLHPTIDSTFLAQRPDIRKAEADLSAASADINRARALMFPAVVLAAEKGWSSEELRRLFSAESAVYSLEATAVQPIFRGGRIVGDIEKTTARRAELVQSYQKAIISAFRDLTNALVAIQKLEEQEKYLQDAVSNAKTANDMAFTNYREGLTDYTAVIDVTRTLFNARNALVDVRLARLLAVVSYFKAIGGLP